MMVEQERYDSMGDTNIIVPVTRTVKDPELFEIFWGATESLLYIETHPTYKVDHELLAAYERGESTDFYRNRSSSIKWFGEIKNFVENVGPCDRIRIVSRIPTKYHQMETDWVYLIASKNAGERVYFVIKEDHPELTDIEDFYIIDRNTDHARYMQLNYTEDHAPIDESTEFCDSASKERLSERVKALEKVAMTLDEYLDYLKKHNILLRAHKE